MLRRNCQHAATVCRQHLRGAILPLVAIFLVVIFVMAAFSVDLAYIELVKVQLRSATDAAARAATSAMVQGKSDTDVVNTAISTAALNTVAGKNLNISAGDIALGQSIIQSDGTYKFQAGVQPYQAVQITASMSKNNANGAVPLFFGSFMGMNSYSPSNTAVAAATSCDVCLVLDRSHSMCWDQSGTSWKYPAPTGLDNFGVLSILTLAPSKLPSGVFQPNPPIAGSRWLALQTAVQSFCDILSASQSSTHVGVVTWASPTAKTTVYSTLKAPFDLPASVGVTKDVDLTDAVGSISAAVAARSQTMLLGGTDMYTGIEGGISVLTGSKARKTATKVMILMTDGDWSSPAGNTDPVTAANHAKSNSIVIHCICFLSSANQTTCKNIASKTGGKFYYATDSASLTAIFQQIAQTLPVALTQ